MVGFVWCLVLVIGADSSGSAAVDTAETESAASDSAHSATVWLEVAPGMELGRFQAEPKPSSGDGVITILRIDPERWGLKLLCSSEVGAASNRSVGQWCQDYGLVAAINAGMFATDHRTHVGYLRNGDHVNSEAVNQYESAVAFSPRREGLPPFRIFDLDENGLEEIEVDYDTVVQNLRMIKRPGKNRWQQQEKRWSEAALGEDSRGRPLFIFSRSAYSVHDLNEILLSLPLDIVCAQHLEGGPEAQFYLRHGKLTLDYVGSFETGFIETDDNSIAWPVPNVFGVVPRQGQAARDDADER